MNTIHARLSIGSRLAGLAAMSLAPVLFLAVLYLGQSWKDVAFTQKEVAGSAYLEQFWPIFSSAAHARAAPHEAVLAFADATRHDAARLAAGDQAAAVARARTPDDVLSSGATLISSVADGSNLTLDPDLDSFYVMDAVTVRLPAVSLAAKKLADLERGASSNHDGELRMAKALEDLTSSAAAADSDFDTAMKNNASGATRAALGTRAASLRQAVAQMTAAADAELAGSASPAGLSNRQAVVQASVDTSWVVANGELQRLLQARISGFLRQIALSGGLVLALLIASATMAFLVARGLTQRIGDLVSAMERIQSGDLAGEVPHATDHHETGRIAKAVTTFREAAREKRRLEDEARLNDKVRAESRTRAAHELADQLETAVADVIGSFAGAATELEATAATLRRSASEEIERSERAALAASLASDNVSLVASTTGEMGKSVAEIAYQVSQSVAMASTAAAKAQTTTATIAELSAAAARIGDVVKLIADVAEQTNLLALNATIESARAGEAGKGFAVVASEVKSLATQTAHATHQISAQIQSIQAIVAQSTGAMTEISDAINELNAIAATINAAVEEQSAATQEIARSTGEAAFGARDVSHNVEQITQRASETGSACDEVVASAQMLGRNADRLKAEVSRFLAEVRAA